jgi:hypothetical protein
MTKYGLAYETLSGKLLRVDTDSFSEFKKSKEQLIKKGDYKWFTTSLTWHKPKGEVRKQ